MLIERKIKKAWCSNCWSLNPYCIGTCSLRKSTMVILNQSYSRLNPYCIGTCSLRIYNYENEKQFGSLNPYCIGTCSLSNAICEKTARYKESLNPYCIGTCSLRRCVID